MVENNTWEIVYEEEEETMISVMNFTGAVSTQSRIWDSVFESNRLAF